MSDADRVRESREAVLERMWNGQYPDDYETQEEREAMRGRDVAALDAYAAAIRAECAAAWRAAIEGLRMKQPNALNCTARLVIHTAAWNAAIEAALASTRHTQGEG